MVRAKLFVLKQEIDLIWTDMTYYRETNQQDQPISEVMGGLITVCFETTSTTDQILRWMTKESQDASGNEVDKMEKGEICFYEDGEDAAPSRTYKFEDAYLVSCTDEFDAQSENALQTVITISPAIQDYGSKVIKEWNVNYVPPGEDTGNQSEEEEVKDEPKFLGYHFEDDQGKRIDQDEIKVDDTIHLVIETENAEDDKITLNLNDDDLDYEYNGKVLKNDTLKGITVTGSKTKIKLKAVAQQ